MNLTPRLRSMVATAATVAALLFTSLGSSPVDGPVGGGLLALWVLGIAAGVVAFVAWASVFSDMAHHRAEEPSTETVRPTEPRT